MRFNGRFPHGTNIDISATHTTISVCIRFGIASQPLRKIRVTEPWCLKMAGSRHDQCKQKVCQQNNIYVHDPEFCAFHSSSPYIYDTIQM